MDMLELLLSQPNIDLNISNERLVAPLLWSIEYISSFVNYNSKDVRPEEFVLRLIRAGCDINLRDKDEATSLHLSILYLPTTSVTYELLKRAADVNAFCSRYGTALHCAIKNTNLELVCMFLYYNADVHIKWEGQKPLCYAVHVRCSEIVTVLDKYYSFIDHDFNYIINSTRECIRFLESTNSVLFKAVWPRFDPEVILSMNSTFIDLFFTYTRCTISDWVECLYLILNSDIAFDLIENYELNTGNSFLQRLLRKMWRTSVQSEDWIGLIYMVLKVGFEVTIDDINSVAIYRSNQDLEPLIYHAYRSVADGSKFICPLHAFVIGMETDYSINKNFRLFCDASKEWKLKFWGWDFYERNFSKKFAKTVAFFSFPADAKNNLMSLKDHRGQVIMDAERLQKIPEFPSLMELSRNQTHKYLVQKFRFKQPYQLQDFVKKLFIPNRIKNIILFKEPIY